MKLLSEARISPIRPEHQIAAFFLAFKGVDNIVKSDGPLTVSSLFTNAIFRNIVISLLATLGLYILASLIFVSSPRASRIWHEC